MDVVAICDVFVVYDGGGNAAESVAAFDVIEEGRLEFLGVTVHKSIRVLAENLHLALMTFRHAVAFESIFVPALFLAHLTVPSQLL